MTSPNQLKIDDIMPVNTRTPYEHFLVLCKIFDILRRQTKIEFLIRYIDFDGFRKRAREPGSVRRAFECLLA
jgi:hypothetical protein